MSEETQEDNVIDIWVKRPCVTGKMTCLSCRHQWMGVAVAGSVWNECPECHCHRGAWQNYIEPVEGTPRFVCTCECQMFYVLGDYIMCVGCGVRTSLEVFK